MQYCPCHSFICVSGSQYFPQDLKSVKGVSCPLQKSFKSKAKIFKFYLVCILIVVDFFNCAFRIYSEFINKCTVEILMTILLKIQKSWPIKLHFLYNIDVEFLSIKSGSLTFHNFASMLFKIQCNIFLCIFVVWKFVFLLFGTAHWIALIVLKSNLVFL